MRAGRRRLDLVEVVQRLGGRHVVRRGADPADAAGDLRHVLGRPADAEHLEAAQLGDLQVGALHVALLVEEDVDLAVALEARDRIDGDALPLPTAAAPVSPFATAPVDWVHGLAFSGFNGLPPSVPARPRGQRPRSASPLARAGERRHDVDELRPDAQLVRRARPSASPTSCVK